LPFLLVATSASAVNVDFEDVGASLPPGSFVNNSLGFTSRSVGFNNEFSDFGGGFVTWGGFSYSNVQDATTPGFFNQYASFAGGGAAAGGGTQPGGTYGVGFEDTFASVRPRITFASDTLVESVKLTNTTYAGLSMRDGDGFAKKFGGASGNDPDYFLLTIHALDAANVETGTLDVYLADYRFANNTLDYILADWTRFDLSSLGAVRALEFSLSSSDNGDFGMNTPAYFVLDDLVAVPEPASGLSLAVGLSAVGLWRRRVQGTRAV
jgi:hypothetical protein